jgi:hypothetical protein
MENIQTNTLENIILDDNELDRLVRFFDVLIEMDCEDKRKNKRSKDTTNVLLDTTNKTPLVI